MNPSEAAQSIGVTDRENDPRMAGVIITRATVNHYIRNELGGVIGPLDFLIENPDIPENIRSAIEQALDGVEGVVKVLDRLNQIKDLSDLTTSACVTYIDLDSKKPGAESK